MEECSDSPSQIDWIADFESVDSVSGTSALAALEYNLLAAVIMSRHSMPTQLFQYHSAFTHGSPAG